VTNRLPPLVQTEVLRIGLTVCEDDINRDWVSPGPQQSAVTYQEDSNQVFRCTMRESFQYITVPVTGGIKLEAQLHSAKTTDGVRPKIGQQGM
jgi:hypothetical protein